MRRRWLFGLVLVLAAPSAPLVAWGVTAHRVVNRVAVTALPASKPAIRNEPH